MDSQNPQENTQKTQKDQTDQNNKRKKELPKSHFFVKLQLKQSSRSIKMPSFDSKQHNVNKLTFRRRNMPQNRVNLNKKDK